MSSQAKQEPVIVLTEDGSHSLYYARLNEHYHSKYGALQESQFIYIKEGLQKVVDVNLKEINILEMGLGTGMNVLLTLSEALNTDLSIHYTALETHPISMEIAQQLNYPELLSKPELEESFHKIHSCEWDKEIAFGSHFYFKKVNIEMQKFITEPKFEVVYYDAFGPAAQPELWTLNIFEKLFEMMLPNALLLTYCAKGEVRRNMQKAGFTVEKLSGPPGKREILRARKIITEAVELEC